MYSKTNLVFIQCFEMLKMKQANRMHRTAECTVAFDYEYPNKQRQKTLVSSVTRGHNLGSCF